MCVCTFDGCPPAQSSYTLNVQDKRIPLWESCEHMWLHFSDYMWLHVGMHYLACITFAYKYDINVRVPATTRAKTVNSFGFCLCQYPGGTHLVVVISLSVHVVNFLWFYKKWRNSLSCLATRRQPACRLGLKSHVYDFGKGFVWPSTWTQDIS